MNYQKKTAMFFIISIICLTYVFYCFTNSVLAGLLISTFVSIFLFYDPKKIKEKREKEANEI